jgi:putative hydrolase of the HAD superfamily
MRIDTTTLLEACDTLMLDMDGTVLDLAFDNFVWKELIPSEFAKRHDMPPARARDELFRRYRSVQGKLDWYCLDHWSERLGLDIMSIHRSVHHRICYLPGAQQFLDAVSRKSIRLLLVTNSHPDTLALKSEMTGIAGFFDEIYSAHSFGHAKEDQAFWRALSKAEAFDPARTLFVDDTAAVLRSAAAYGVENLLRVTWPDSTIPPRHDPSFAGVESIAELLA